MSSTYNIDTAMRYGSMPDEMLMSKFDLNDEADGNDGEDKYNHYARELLMDRTNDTPAMESDLPRTSGASSSGIINQRYNGGRGTVNTPSHSEMFLELTERETRGQNVEPRMDAMIEQKKARMGYVRFSSDADPSIHEGRWSEGVAFDKTRVQTQKQKKLRMKIFSTQKDGRRNGMRKEYQHKSIVGKVEDDLSLFRPTGTDFSDYIADEALKTRKTNNLSENVVAAARIYNLNTPDHEFKEGLMGQSRKQVTTTESQSKVVGVRVESTSVAPESLDAPSQTKAYKAAGILMGAIVHGLDKVRHDNKVDGVTDVNSQTGRKTAALQRDLAIVAKEAVTTNDFGTSSTTSLGKTANQTRVDSGIRTVVFDSTKPAHILLAVEKMYKNVVPSGDIVAGKHRTITDSKPTDELKDKKAGKSGIMKKARMAVGTIMKVKGENLDTPIYKAPVSKVNTNTVFAASQTTERFADYSLDSQTRRRQSTGPASQTTDGKELMTSFGLTAEQNHREVVQRTDKSTVRRQSVSNFENEF